MLASASLNGSAQRTVPPRAAEQVIWSGASAGYAIQWTTGDLAARPASNATTAIFSGRQLARKEFAAIEKDSDVHCEYERPFKFSR
ncbi:MAG: hypothetical protein V7641_5068 [Blastocatellia bacterium]